MLRELREHGEVSLETRRALAAEAFATRPHTRRRSRRGSRAASAFPEQLTLSFRKVSDLPYGENPHQAAALYWEVGARKHLLSRVEQLGGKELSYNNLADLEGARRVARELTEPAVVIVKHGNPCGVAVATTIEEAWERALAADPMSAYGCVAILNRTVTGTLGERIAEHFVEVLFAPGYAPDALEALPAKQALRILQDGERRKDTPGERDFRRVLGGLLVQDRDVETQEREAMSVACGDVPDEHVGRPALRLARVQARLVERDRARTRPADDRDRRGPDEPRRRGADRRREGPRARPRHARCRARERRVLPVRGRRAARARAGIAAIVQPGGSKPRRRGARRSRPPERPWC